MTLKGQLGSIQSSENLNLNNLFAADSIQVVKTVCVSMDLPPGKKSADINEHLQRLIIYPKCNTMVKHRTSSGRLGSQVEYGF